MRRRFASRCCADAHALKFDFSVFDVPRLNEMYEQCMPYYEKLYAARVQP
jgi:hypothetical protein